jgi:hypothetical protein
MSDNKNISPGVVAVVRLEDSCMQPIYATDGTDISAMSVAVIYDDVLYIGQVFDGFLFKVQLKEKNK